MGRLPLPVMDKLGRAAWQCPQDARRDFVPFLACDLDFNPIANAFPKPKVHLGDSGERIIDSPLERG